MLNEVIHNAWVLPVVCSEPATPQGGDVVRWGFLTGVAVDDENAAGVTVVDFGQRVHALSVTAAGAIAVGDTLFYDSGTDALNNTTTGTPFGYAMAIVGGGLTAVINVLHVPGHGAATLGAGVIGAANLAANAAETAKINNLAVTTGKINTNAVTGAKLATGVVKVTLIAGAAAGAHVCTGMAVGDEIVSVIHITTAAAIATMADLTSEFTAGVDDANNAAGTDTTNDQLMVIWIDKS